MFFNFVKIFFHYQSFECYTDFCKSLNVSLKYLQTLREEKKQLKNFLRVNNNKLFNFNYLNFT